MALLKEEIRSYTMQRDLYTRKVCRFRLIIEPKISNRSTQTMSRTTRRSTSYLEPRSQRRLWQSSSTNGTPTTFRIRPQFMRLAQCSHISWLGISAVLTKLSLSSHRGYLLPIPPSVSKMSAVPVPIFGSSLRCLY